MAEINAKYISAIRIPDWEKGVTKRNEHFFNLQSEPPRCLLGHRATLQVSLLIAGFICAYIFQDQVIRYSIIFVTFAIGLWYLYESRYRRIYIRLQRSYMFSRDKKVLACVNRLVGAKRLFVEGMPAIYSILKGRERLAARDYLAAEYLADQVLSRQPDNAEALYIKALCKYAADDREGARQMSERLDGAAGGGEYSARLAELMEA